jgi:teichuronic acid biosynthesis glycosyltransferase TuaG
MSNLLISICIPAYNAAVFIGDTLQSIKNQTYLNWELIIIEDGSDDGTTLIVEEFKKTVSQDVIYYKNPVNKGLSATRNIAASKATGCWLAFVDSDDIWHPDHLQSLMSTAQENINCDFIHSGFNFFYEDYNKPFYEQNLSEKVVNAFPISLYTGEYRIQPSSIMVSQKLYTAVNGFNEDYRSVEDLNLYFRSSEQGFKFAYSGKNTCFYRRNLDGLTSHSLNMAHYCAKVYTDTLGWQAIPKNLRLKKIAEHWLSTARLARKTDPVLAKSAIKTAMKYRVDLRSLAILLLIYVELPLTNKAPKK